MRRGNALVAWCLSASALLLGGDPAQAQEPGRLDLKLEPVPGAAGADPAPAEPTATPRALTPEERAALLDRLDPLPPTEETEKAPPTGEGLTPPPGADQVAQPLAPPPPAAAEGPPRVLRCIPRGPVAVARRVSLAFSEAMVALGQEGWLAPEAVPARLVPPQPGRWRWVGTRMLVFEPTAERLPIASEFRVELREDLRSAGGAPLAGERRFAFQTGLPPVAQHYPPARAEALPRRPLVALGFAQPITTAELEPFLRLWRVDDAAAERTPVALELLTPAQLPSALAAAREAATSWRMRSTLARLEQAAPAGRVVAIRPREDQPRGARLELEVQLPGPANQGPRPGARAVAFSFHVYGPLRVHEQSDGEERPGSSWSIRFSNPLDEGSISPAQVRVEPALEALELRVWKDRLHLEGRSLPARSYRVHLAPGIRDRFGQTLGEQAPIEIRVGSARPRLSAPDSQFAVLDPALPPHFPVYCEGIRALRLRLHAVTPDGWPAFAAYSRYHSRYWPRDQERPPPPPLPPGQVFERRLEGIAPHELSQQLIDLSPVLSEDGLGHVILVVEVDHELPKRHHAEPLRVWIQRSHLDVQAVVGPGRTLAWVSSLLDGSPRGEVSVQRFPDESTATTDAQGIASFAAPASLDRQAPPCLVARTGSDAAILPQVRWRQPQTRSQLLWHLQDDRGLYRPGEPLAVKGWVRRLASGPRGDLQLPGASLETVSWTLESRRGGAELARGNVSVSPSGSFDLRVDLPADAPLGSAELKLDAGSPWSGRGGAHRHRIRIEEYRLPVLEMDLDLPTGPLPPARALELAARVRYYGAGPAAGAELRWAVDQEPARYVPLGQRTFHFGTWTPWWNAARRYSYRQENDHVLEGQADATGRHAVRLRLPAQGPPHPTALELEVRVQGGERRSWSQTARLLVLPADVLVGLRVPSPLVPASTPTELSFLVCDVQGTPAADHPVQLELMRIRSVRRDGRTVEEEELVRREAVSSRGAAQSWSFVPGQPGRYRLRATVLDAAERRHRSELTLWAADPERAAEPNDTRGPAPELLVPDAPRYAPGQVARLLVQSPFPRAEGLLVLDHQGIATHRRFLVEGGATTLEVPLDASLIPGVEAQVILIPAGPRGADEPGPPQAKRATRRLPIGYATRRLRVALTPRARVLKPGARSAIDVGVHDSSGAPVAGAEVALFVVDEAALDLAGFSLRDPLAAFHGWRAGKVRTRDVRRALVPSAPRDMKRMKDLQEERRRMASMGAGAASASLGESIRERIDLRALALFAPTLRTDAQGRASAELTLPDSLTRYRVFALASQGAARFGRAESSLEARLPLQVRAQPPRFLNLGDRCQLPVMVHNLGDEALDVQVALRTRNLRVLESGKGLRLAAGARAELRFPVEALAPGTAQVQVTAAAGEAADAARLSFPVHVPAAAETAAVYGELQAGTRSLPIAVPATALADHGGLELELAATQLEALASAAVYLVRYPYSCTEQVSSRVLALCSLREVLDGLNAAGLPDRRAVDALLAEDVHLLCSRQDSQGGFKLWPTGSTRYFTSVYATHALAVAQANGLALRPKSLQNAQRYLARRLPRALQRKAAGWDAGARRAVLAYALMVRRLLGDEDAAAARALLAEGPLGVEAAAWLLEALNGVADAADERALLLQQVHNALHEEAGGAQLGALYGDTEHRLFYSSRRGEAVVLSALLAADPESELIAKLTRELLAGREAGRWANTQENAWCLLALAAVFRTREAVSPELDVEAWLGGTYLGKQRFEGRGPGQAFRLPMAWLQAQGKDPALVLRVSGRGRLMYRAALEHVPASLEQAPQEQGLAVTRRYEAIDAPGDVRRDPDGTWRLRAGARIRVRLEVASAERRRHLALVDALPAGVEPLNPALAGTGALPAPSGPRWWEYVERRDAATHVFTSSLGAGVHVFEHVVEATTPGTFRAGPARAEAMYSPEIQGRSGTARVVVE